MFKQTLSVLKISTLALILSFGLSYALAWTSPTQNPPSGNVDAPINTGSTAQSKSGPLSIGTTASVQTLTVAGDIGATGDICTTAGGGRCLGTVTGGLPTGTSGQTLRHDGANWLANSNLFNNGTNVGINNTAPAFDLSLATMFGLQKGDISPNAGYLRFGDNTGWKYIIGRAKESPASAINTTTTGALVTVQDNGNVGIGTTNPTDMLTVTSPASGSIIRLIDSGATDMHAWRLISNAPDGGFAIRDETNARNLMQFTTAGNVGIGTTAPATKLDVDGNITQTVTHGNNMKLWFPASRNGGGTGEVGLYSWISEPGVTWTGGGIARNMYNTTNFPRINTGLSGQMMHFTEGGNVEFTLETAAGARTTPLAMTNAGNVGIGTTAPTSALHLSGDRAATFGPNSTWGANLTVGGNGRTTTNASVVATNGNLHLDSQNGGYGTYINYYSGGPTVINAAGGNVGIGTTAPTKKLDVVGGDAVINGVIVGKGGGNGTTNTANGYSSLAYNTTGSTNTANGYGSLLFNTTGSSNTAVGANTLYANTTGTNNTAVGAHALAYSNTTGVNNTAVGSATLYSNTGNNNAAFGLSALYANTTGYNNTAMGNATLSSNTTGTFNTAIGYGANVSYGALTNATAIGNGAVVSWSNTMFLGNSNLAQVYSYAPFSQYSDRRKKENIAEYTHGLDFILKLRPVTYNMTTDSEKKTRSGFIAQEVEETGVPFYGLNKPRDASDFYTLNYSEFVVPLVNSVKELKAENDKLKADNEALRAEIKATNDALIARIEKLEKAN